jgi:tRNA nucleotidyltransferase/poly(A) polymerase
MADYIYIMESRLTPEQQRGVTLVQEVARAHGMNIYLVGGVVRDIISGASIRDLDFAVQGNALKLVKDLEKAGAVIEGTDEHLRTAYVLRRFTTSQASHRRCHRQRSTKMCVVATSP